MTGRRKTGRGLEKWQIRHGGIAPVIWEECTRGHILNSAAVAWLMFNSVKNIQYYSTHLWRNGSDTNTRFRKQSGSSRGAEFREVVHSTDTQIGWVSNLYGMNYEEACGICCYTGIIFMVVQNPGTMIYTHQSKIRLLRQIFLRYSADHLSFWNIFNITLTFLIGKSSNVDSQRRQSGALHSSDANVCLLPSNNVDWPSKTSYLIDFLDHSREAVPSKSPDCIDLYTQPGWQPIRLLSRWSKPDEGGSRSSAFPHLLRDKNTAHTQMRGEICDSGRATRGPTTAPKENY